MKRLTFVGIHGTCLMILVYPEQCEGLYSILWFLSREVYQQNLSRPTLASSQVHHSECYSHALILHQPPPVLVWITLHRMSKSARRLLLKNVSRSEPDDLLSQKPDTSWGLSLKGAERDKVPLASHDYLILKNIRCFFIQIVSPLINNFEVFCVLFIAKHLSNKNTQSGLNKVGSIFKLIWLLVNDFQQVFW